MQYGNEDKNEGEINKDMVPKFNRLQLKRGIINNDDEEINSKRMKVGQNSKVVIMGKMKAIVC